jgi:hypothetical protein
VYGNAKWKDEVTKSTRENTNEKKKKDENGKVEEDKKK